VVARLRRGDARIERAEGHLKQPLRGLVDLADRDGGRGIGVIALVPDADIDRHEIPFHELPRARRDAMDDLIVDRRAYAGREIVQPLEGRSRAIVGPNEILGQLVEVGCRHARFHRCREQCDGLSENPPALGHYVDLAR
jgi:hypothetical protein